MRDLILFEELLRGFLIMSFCAKLGKLALKRKLVLHNVAQRQQQKVALKREKWLCCWYGRGRLVSLKKHN